MPHQLLCPLMPLPALPVSESTFQLPTQNPQPFCSLSAFGYSWTQPSLL